MAQSQRSLRLTETYRRQLVALGTRVEAQARELWPRIEDFDVSQWPEQMASVVSRAQTQAVRLTAGYLGAYVRSETGRRGPAVQIDSRRYAGVSRDGRPLSEAMRSPFVAVLGALADSRPPDEALRIGLAKGVRFAGFETVQTGRDALADTVEEDERFTGQERAVSGTCAACMALSGTPNMEVHPGCFVGETRVSGPDPSAATTRWYEGELVELRFGDDLLTCTPNHPVLTPRGYRAAHLLHEGSDVVRCRGEQRGVSAVHPHDDERPTTIKQVAESFGSSGRVASVTVPVAPEDFHGDGTLREGADCQIDVVRPDGFLQRDRGVEVRDLVPEFSREPSLCLSCARLIAFARLSHFGSLLRRVFAARRGAMSGFGVAPMFLGSPLAVAQLGPLTEVSNLYSGVQEEPTNRNATDPVPSRKGLLRFAGEITTDHVLSVRRFPFSGHVYNLQSSVDAWYIANRTVVHNCECVGQPTVRGVVNRFALPTGAALFAAMSKAEQDSKVGPEAAQLIRDGEADLKDFVAHSKTDSDQPNWITQKSAQDVPATN